MRDIIASIGGIDYTQGELDAMTRKNPQTFDWMALEPDARLAAAKRVGLTAAQIAQYCKLHYSIPISQETYFKAVVEMTAAMVVTHPTYEPEYLANDAINKVNAIIKAINQRNA